MKYLKYAVLTSVLLVLAACGQVAGPEGELEVLDNVQNTVETVGTAKIRSFTQGSSTSVKYYIQQNSAGGVHGCDVSDTTSAVIRITPESGILVNGTTFVDLTFKSCGDSETNTQTVTFSGGTAGSTYAVTHTKVSGPTTVHPSSANFSLQVNAAAVTQTTPSIILARTTSSANPSLLGAEVSFTATVAAISPATGIPSGFVQFIINSVEVGDPVALNSGVATLTHRFNAVGSYTIGATYLGDSNFNGVSAATLTQRVIYDFAGFFRPIDNDGILNVVKAGSAVPVKFSLGGDQGLGIMPATPKAPTMVCNPDAAVDLVDQTVTASNSSLSYDAVANQYVYVWKTDKAWTGCRQLQITLADGQTYTANFKFTK